MVRGGRAGGAAALMHDVVYVCHCMCVALADIGARTTRGAGIVVGMGRKNPNAARGRERRGQKKTKPDHAF